jgi:hypothetical protein
MLVLIFIHSLLYLLVSMYNCNDDSIIKTSNNRVHVIALGAEAQGKFDPL